MIQELHKRKSGGGYLHDHVRGQWLALLQKAEEIEDDGGGGDDLVFLLFQGL